MLKSHAPHQSKLFSGPPVASSTARGVACFKGCTNVQAKTTPSVKPNRYRPRIAQELCLSAEYRKNRRRVALEAQNRTLDIFACSLVRSMTFMPVVCDVILENIHSQIKESVHTNRAHGTGGLVAQTVICLSSLHSQCCDHHHARRGTSTRVTGAESRVECQAARPATAISNVRAGDSAASARAMR